MSFTESQLDAALQLARQGLLAEFGLAEVAEVPADLSQLGASFVTLLKDGQLRGCIGSLEAYQPLGQDILANTRRAAFEDPRFAPVSAGELAQLELEVSLLTRPQPMAVAEEAELLRRIRPGEDGLIVQCGAQRATFLPSVWQQLAQPQEFVAALKAKAGLSGDFWSPRMRWWCYRTASVRGRLLQS